MSVPQPVTRPDRQMSGSVASSATTTPSRPLASTAGSLCGPFLNTCTCRQRPITPRSPEEMRARHEAAVARARRSGWGSWIAPRPLRIVADPTGRRWAA